MDPLLACQSLMQLHHLLTHLLNLNKGWWLRLLLHCALLLIISVFVLETISHLVHSPIEVRSS